MPTESRSIFFDEWQACLRSHYIHVLRADDGITEPTLRAVLLHTGLTARDLDDLRAEADRLGPLEAGPVPETAEEPAAVPDEALLAEGDDLGDELSAPL